MRSKDNRTVGNRGRLLIALAIAAGVAGLPVFWLLSDTTIGIRIPQSAVQQEIDRKLPVEGARGSLHYQVREARVDFRAGGRIGLSVVLHADMGQRQAVGYLTGSAVLSYVDGAFFLHDFQADPQQLDIQVTGPSKPDPGPWDTLVSKANGLLDRVDPDDRRRDLFDAGEAELTARIKVAIIDFLRIILDRLPVYRLKDGDTRQELAKLVLRGVRSEPSFLYVTLDLGTGAEP